MLNLPANVKHYNDKPEISNSATPKGFTGLRKIKTALIATKPGELTLPEISLQWWDLKASQARLTQLPARKIQVEEGLAAVATPEADKQIASATKREIDERFAGDIENQQKQIVRSSTILPMWAWGLIGLNSIWIFIFFKYIFKRAFNKIPVKNVDTRTFSSRNVKSLLKKACKDNDPKEAEKHLLAWAKIQFPEVAVSSLAQIKIHFESPLQEAIKELNAALYGQNKSWEGKSLWLAIAGYKSKRLSKNHESPQKLNEIEKLYS